MNNNRRVKQLLTALTSIALLALSACLEEATVKTGKNENQNKPFVEAFIEFQGPSSKWAGPESMSIQLNARAADKVSVSVLPKWLLADTDAIAVSDFSARGKVSPAAAREYLSFLAAIVQKSPDEKWQGCLSPVHIKLISEDGQIVEKTSCRSLNGWPIEASRAAHKILSSVLLGTAMLEPEHK
jgi:hypothetical protein